MIIRMKKESLLKNRKDLIETLTGKGYTIKDMSGPFCGVLGVMGDIKNTDVDEIERSEGVEGVTRLKSQPETTYTSCQEKTSNTLESMKVRVFTVAEQ